MSNNFDNSVKFNLASSVEYSNGGIISKQIIRNDAGNVTLFSFDESQSLSEHTAPYDALLQIIEGKATVTIGGKEQTLAEGEAVIMPADIPHALKAETKLKMILTMIKGKQ